jgi:hypothetical protein
VTILKLGTYLVAVSAVSFAADFNPSIQLQAVRDAAAKLTPPERAITCEDKSRPPNVADLCNKLRHLVGPDQIQVGFAMYALRKQDSLFDASGLFSFLASAAESRIDSQNGASSGGSGTTSVVERSGISDVLGAALEAGAVTQSVSGSSLTLQGNALSLKRFLTPNDSVFKYCSYDKPDCNGEFEQILNRFSGSASLSLSNQSTQTVAGTVTGASGTSGASGSNMQSASVLLQDSASHLSGFTIRFQAINSLDLRSKAYLDAWQKAIKDPSITNLAETARGKFAQAFQSFYNPDELKKPSDYKWLGDAMESLRKLAIAGSDDAKMISEVTQAWDALISQWPQGNNYAASLQDFLQAVNAYMAARDLAINNVRQTLASGLTFEYAYSRPDNQPRVSTARVIYTLHPGTISTDMSTSTTQPGAKPAAAAVPQSKTGTTAGAAKPKTTNDTAITFNFAADFYDNPPPGTGTLRDLQGALQLDHHFGNTIATLAGYYQYQNAPAALMIGAGNLAPGTNIMLNGTAATLLAPKGNIVVAQAMVTFPLKSGTKLPLGVTWSNRTDLIKGNELRGHVGFNFDWSSLLLGGQAKSANPSQP